MPDLHLIIYELLGDFVAAAVIDKTAAVRTAIKRYQRR